MINGLIRLSPYTLKFQALTGNFLSVFERELKQAFGKLSKSHNRQFLRDVLNNINEAVLILDGHGRVIDINNKTLSLFAAKPRDILGRSFFTELMCEQCSQQDFEKVRDELAKKEEVLLERKAKKLFGGVTFDSEIFVKNIISDEDVAILVTVRDITKHKQREETLQRLATTDELTGIYNRRQFMNLLNKEIVRSKRYMHSLSVVMIDVDHFKQVNDRYGHDVGDKVLVELVTLISQELRDIDIFGRLGGEEFCVVFPETSIEKAHHAAERMRMLVANHKLQNGAGFFNISISAGITAGNSGVESADVLLKQADIALYQAKRQGRNRVVIKNSADSERV